MFLDTQNLTEIKITYILVPHLYYPLPFSTFFIMNVVNHKGRRVCINNPIINRNYCFLQDIWLLQMSQITVVIV